MTTLLREDHVRRTLESLEPQRFPRRETTKLAAVATVLRYPRTGEPEVLLIRRTEHPNDPWSGHVAFPGGRHDPADRSLEDTAIRETQEEVGVDLRSGADYLGRLHEVEAIAASRRIDLIIVPHVFVLRRPVTLVPRPEEVDEAFFTPLTPLLSGEAEAVHPYVFEGRPLDLPAYRVGEKLIWGLTHRMLATFFAELRAASGDAPSPAC